MNTPGCQSWFKNGDCGAEDFLLISKSAVVSEGAEIRSAATQEIDCEDKHKVGGCDKKQD